MSIKFQAKHPNGFTIDSPLQAFTFPDGAVHIKGADAEQRYEYQIADVRGLSHDDLFTLAMWTEVCREREEKTVLILPYIPGARMDRGVPAGGQVYAWFINDIVSPNQVITIDPHSDTALHYLEEGYLLAASSGFRHKTTVFPVERIIRKEVQDASRDDKGNDTYQGVIAPDKGAHDRAAAAAEVMGVPVYTGGKTRDFDSGKITGFHMEDQLPETGRFLIVDDICDGGGTFLALAEATGLPKERLDLWVTHGIFSKGLPGLREHFGVVHTTDSYYRGHLSESGTFLGGNFTWNHDPDLVKVHPLTPYLYGEIDL